MAIKKPYYSLIEAAELLGCSHADVFHLGAYAKLELMVGVPEAIALKACDMGVGPQNNPVREPFFLVSPDFLVLQRSQCRKLETSKEAHFAEFPLSYVCRSDGTLQAVRANYGYPDFRLNAVWCWRALKRYQLAQ